jgi:hypothetical protein
VPLTCSLLRILHLPNHFHSLDPWSWTSHQAWIFLDCRISERWCSFPSRYRSCRRPQQLSQGYGNPARRFLREYSKAHNTWSQLTKLNRLPSLSQFTSTPSAQKSWTVSVPHRLGIPMRVEQSLVISTMLQRSTLWRRGPPPAWSTLSKEIKSG